MGFFKFPTTPHVLDLTNGKALTDSDRLLSAKEAEEFFDAWSCVFLADDELVAT